MSCDSPPPMVIARNLSKIYHLYSNPRDRLKQILWRGRRCYYREFKALDDVSFEVNPGEVLGIIGRNGAGKSTLLQVICGILDPTSGEILTRGRVAALLELGAGFNPEFSGRENVIMSAAVMGLSSTEIMSRLEDIIEFSGIRDFIDQPVKTYSSGMYVRLAFSVATSIDPDILVIDEALSVGDGEFSRKSFDRIMTLKEAGKTILFCSHALYQVEALCDSAIWLSEGRVVKIGEPAEVVMAYDSFIGRQGKKTECPLEIGDNTGGGDEDLEVNYVNAPCGTAKFASVVVSVDNLTGTTLVAQSGLSDLAVAVKFVFDSNLPTPNVGVCLVGDDGRVVASVGTHIDHHLIKSKLPGVGETEVKFPCFSLLRGKFKVDVYLLCERGVHVYDAVAGVAAISVKQFTMELGVVTLPHKWT